MAERNFVIDLGRVEGPVYTGRDRGVALREKLNVEHREDEVEEVEVIIPDSVYTVSSSFFLGLFGPSVKKCGSVKGFEHKYHFKAPEFLLPILSQHASKALQDKRLFS